MSRLRGGNSSMISLFQRFGTPVIRATALHRVLLPSRRRSLVPIHLVRSTILSPRFITPTPTQPRLAHFSTSTALLNRPPPPLYPPGTPPPSDGPDALKTEEEKQNEIDDEWQQYDDPRTGEFYYYNLRTNEVTWKEPKYSYPVGKGIDESGWWSMLRSDRWNTNPLQGASKKLKLVWGVTMSVMLGTVAYGYFTREAETEVERTQRLARETIQDVKDGRVEKHVCVTCGAQFKYEDVFQSHMEWHTRRGK